MTLLNTAQEDAIIEVVNVGVSKSAKVLSKLLKQRVNLSIPSVKLVDLEERYLVDIFKYKSSISYIYQHLSGGINGCVFLLYEEKQSELFMTSILEDVKQLKESKIPLFTEEAMLEVGNVIVSALLSGMANVLKTTVKIGVPLFGKSECDELTSKIIKHSTEAGENTTKIFIFRALMETKIAENQVYLDIVLSMSSMEAFIEAIDALLKG